MGRSERSALMSDIGTVIEHLLKVEASPALEPRAGWKETVIRTQSATEEMLEGNPSLRPTVDDSIARALVQRHRLVSDVLALYGEEPRVELSHIRYTTAQVLGPWFYDDCG